MEGVEAKNEDINLGTEDDNSKIVEDRKLILRQEELDIAKNRVQIGQVELSKEIVEEQKEVDVPVIHEEVVIERRAIDRHPSDSPITEEETIRIPVTEERVEVGKHTVVTGEVSAYKREVGETKKVVETLKKEEARVHKDGEPHIIGNDGDYTLH
ncbi:YsnF/AvaK domain-containing protein [Pseudobacteroides cellulosolvens]|uniref:YsnF/AvaK domain-containing protein n=1 Tax=Pseudobacteroides cellulosolvens TaxID=35825 RepID=UPI00390891E4